MTKSMHRAQMIRQLQHNQRLKSLPPTISLHPAAMIKEDDDLTTPPPTPYGTPHVTSVLYGAHLGNLCENNDIGFNNEVFFGLLSPYLILFTFAQRRGYISTKHKSIKWT